MTSLPGPDQLAKRYLCPYCNEAATEGVDAVVDSFGGHAHGQCLVDVLYTNARADKAKNDRLTAERQEAHEKQQINAMFYADATVRAGIQRKRAEAAEAELSAVRADRDASVQLAALIKADYAAACDAAEAEGARADRLEAALREYHDLAPAVAECVNDCGAALLYTDLHRANQHAEAALAAAGSPGTQEEAQLMRGER